MSPFQYLWNGYHLLLSPAASHSGYEDHVQSDQFHYVHHAKFNCNYGSGSFPLDRIFGTFEDILHSEKQAEKYEHKKRAKQISTQRNDMPFQPKSGRSFQMFMGFTAVYSVLTIIVLFDGAGIQNILQNQHIFQKMVTFGLTLSAVYPRLFSFWIGFGPVLFGIVMSLCSGQRLFRSFGDTAMKGKGMKVKYRLPSFVVHLMMGLMIGVYPVYVFAKAALA